MLNKLRSDLKELKNPEKAKLLQRFFKTGSGGYGEGDVFLGITVPESRKIAIKYKNLELKEVEALLNSKIHEERLIALLLLVHNCELAKKSEDNNKIKEIVDFYLKNTKYVNNWDLVDLSCHQIVGNYLLNKDRSILYKLAKSNKLLEKRNSINSAFAFIRYSQFKDSLNLAKILLNDKHDLINKAVGWMLREIGKKDKAVLIKFLSKNYKHMPRTTLRYSIERLSEKQRKGLLRKI